MSKPILTATSGNHRPDQEAIAARAYEISQRRGSAPGHEIDDWLQAEAELLAEARAKPAAAAAGPAARALPDRAPRRDRDRNGGKRSLRLPQSQ